MKVLWGSLLAAALAAGCQDRAVTATQAAHDDGDRALMRRGAFGEVVQRFGRMV